MQRLKYRKVRYYRSGFALVVALIFVSVFMAMSAGMAIKASATVQAARNHKLANRALNAALSGLECARYQVTKVPTFSTDTNTVTDAQANTIWTNLQTRLNTIRLGGQNVISQRFTDLNGSGDELLTAAVPVGQNGGQFRLRFRRYDTAPKTILIQSLGYDGAISRTVQVEATVTKSAEVLRYAIAGRGRMWLTGDTTIRGSIYSAYGKRADGSLINVSPFNTTPETRIEGTVNTILTKQEIDSLIYQLETLAEVPDGNGGYVSKPMFYYGTQAYDINGRPISDSYGPVDNNGFLLDSWGLPVYDGNGQRIAANFANRYYSAIDELQGYHEGVNYGQPNQTNIPGLKITDYNTTIYRNMIPNVIVSAGSAVIANGRLSTSGVPTVIEYFPHQPMSQGGYTQPKNSSSLKITRYVYQNKTLRNVRVDSNTNALFKNCTFEGVLYIDCATNTSSYFNNIRFENCTFNGVIVTNTPSQLSWQRNALYFTGSATFNNQSTIQEATILAPHFNVDLGNTNPIGNDINRLTGAIVGGIVDVRGNAVIEGTIISMADTSAYTSGFVTNIGATLNDGGSETTELGDVGTIVITPNPDNLLPSGITTPVIIKPKLDTYRELITME